VSFAYEKDEIPVEGSESNSSDESDVPDFDESFSEGELWSSSDEESAELFERVFEGACIPGSSAIKVKTRSRQKSVAPSARQGYLTA